MKLYFKYVLMHLKSALEYKSTLMLTIFAKFAMSFFTLLSVYFLFDKFGSIDGYTFENVVICFAISYLGYSIAECFFRAFDRFDRMLGNGEFDRILVRPRNLILQVLGSEIEFSRIGRASVAIIICIWVIAKQPELWHIDKIITLILMLLGTIILYASLFILKAGITFFTTQGLEIMNIFTDGARDLAQYPLSIYNKWVLRFFTYIVPLALVNYYPLLYLINKSDNKLYIIIPIFVLIFFIPCYTIWRIGVKKYKSTGS